MRKQKDIHYIYKTTCLVTGRYYIGMHSTDNLEDGYLGSGKRLWFSLNYHGRENHIKEILEFLPDRVTLRRREKEIVTSDLIKENLCMNLVVGGEGGFISLSGCTKGGLTAGNLIKKRIETDSEFKEKTLATLHNNMKNVWKTPEMVKKILTNLELGRGKHSEKYKKRLSSIKKGTGIGQSNSQYGTCWITNGRENKKIKKEDISQYINSGWVQGRLNLK